MSEDGYKATLNPAQEAEARLHPRRCCIKEPDLFQEDLVVKNMIRCDEILTLDIGIELDDGTRKVRMYCSFHHWVEWKDTRVKE